MSDKTNSGGYPVVLAERYLLGDVIGEGTYGTVRKGKDLWSQYETTVLFFTNVIGMNVHVPVLVPVPVCLMSSLLSSYKNKSIEVVQVTEDMSGTTLHYIT